MPISRVVYLPAGCSNEQQFLERMAAALLQPKETMLRPSVQLERRQQQAANAAAQQQRLATEQQADQAYLQELQSRGFVKQCPQCRVLIERFQGCLHMTCRACRHEFWWCCLQNFRGSQHGFNSCNTIINRP